MSEIALDPEDLFAKARSGDETALGRLLDRYRNYLHLLARALIAKKLQGQFDASDVVQDALLQAHRDLPQFRAESEPELVAWLRAILVHDLANRAKHDHRLKRDSQRLVSLDLLLERSCQAIGAALVASGTSPSSSAARREMAVLVADALARLPDDQRMALELHHVQGLTMRQTAHAMGRTPASVMGLVIRGGRTMRALLNHTSPEN